MNKEELNNIICECNKDYEILNEDFELNEKLEKEYNVSTGKQLKKEIKQLQKITITKRGNYLEVSVGKVNKLFKINEEFQKWIEEIK